MMTNFDQPDTMTSCPARPTSTHALQALSLMNSDFAQDRAKAFAARLEKECGKDRACAVKSAYRVALGRRPSPAEIAMAQEFFAKKGQLAEYCVAMMNRNEFVYAP